MTDRAAIIEVTHYESGCHTDNPVTVKILLNMRRITTISPLYSLDYDTFYEIRFGSNQTVVVNEADYERIAVELGGLYL